MPAGQALAAPPEHMVASDDIMRKENEVHL